MQFRIIHPRLLFILPRPGLAFGIYLLSFYPPFSVAYMYSNIRIHSKNHQNVERIESIVGLKGHLFNEAFKITSKCKHRVLFNKAFKITSNCKHRVLFNEAFKITSNCTYRVMFNETFKITSNFKHRVFFHWVFFL